MTTAAKNQSAPPAPDAAKAPDKAPDPAPTPPAADAGDELLAQVEAKKKELAKLKAEKELEILNAEIEKLRNGGMSADQVARRDRAIAKREKTFKEEIGGKKYAKYLVPEPSYKPAFPGQPAIFRPANFVVTVDYDVLPSEGWRAVAKKPQAEATEFASAE